MCNFQLTQHVQQTSLPVTTVAVSTRTGFVMETMIVMISLMNKTVRQQVKAKFYYNDCHDFSDEHQNCTTTGKGQVLLQ